jgi:hypothetical protein
MKKPKGATFLEWLTANQWSHDTVDDDGVTGPSCLICGAFKRSGEHDADCSLARSLKEGQ